MKLSIGLIALAAVFSMTIPAYVCGQSQIAALPPALGPTAASTSPSTMPTAQCIDFNSDGVCEYVLLANGTMISNPLLYIQQGQSVPLVQQQQQQPVNPMTQLVERQKIIIQQEKARADNDDGDNDRDDDDNDLPPCSPATIYKECADTDDDSNDDDNDTGGSNPDGEEEDQNCGGEACTDDEKEDSWLDDESENFEEEAEAEEEP